MRMADDTNAPSAAAEKAPARKASARTAPPRKAASGDGAQSGSEREGRPPKAAQVAGRAARQLGELIGKEVEGVVGLERSDAGWKVLVEVLELRRVPTTTDVLATYEVSVDTSGDLEGYRRLQRYARGATRDE
jgi:uncharacterized protein YdbL (DUF1318 family)